VEALLIGGCIAPTDPVLANCIVRGRFAEKHVPLHVRNILSAESGANDGLGYPYIFIALLLMLRESKSATVGEAIGEWVYNVWIYQILLSCVLGYLIGHAARIGLRYAHEHDWIDKESLLAFSFSFALFLMGSVSIVGTDDLLAIFVAGNAFTWDDWFRIKIEETHIQEVIDMLFTSIYFIYFGGMIPWASFEALGLVHLLLLSLTVLLFRRLPIVLAMYNLIPAIVTYREALFAGWFGPIGAGAIFYALEAYKVLDEHDYNEGNIRRVMFPAVMWLVFSSVVIHGITVPLMKIGKRVTREVIAPFSRSVTEMSRTSTMNTTKRKSNPPHITQDMKIIHLHRMDDLEGFDEQLPSDASVRDSVVNWADTPLHADS
jgi:NhaP-type Na+/H+ or K+/H+ antiporter